MKIVCSICSRLETIIWHKENNGTVICNECFLRPKQQTFIVSSQEENGNEDVESTVAHSENTVDRSHLTSSVIRKSNRMRASKYKFSHMSKILASKGRSRRIIFKRNPVKSATEVATIHASEYIFHNGTYWQIGDIVSVIDEDDGKTYYAQIRGFLQDQFNNKSAALTWLLPTTASPADQFDPASYIIGPDEDIARKMESFEFVCHAPSEYYKLRTAPYSVDDQAEVGYIMTSLGFKCVSKLDKEQLYNFSIENMDDDNVELCDSKSIPLDMRESVIKAKVKSSRLNTTKNLGRPKSDKK